MSININSIGNPFFKFKIFNSLFINWIDTFANVNDDDNNVTLGVLFFAPQSNYEFFLTLKLQMVDF